MLRNQILYTVMTTAFVFALGACGKSNSAPSRSTVAQSRPTAPAPTAPTTDAKSALQGTWKAACNLNYNPGIPYTTKIAFNGDLVTQSYQKYSDSDCTTPDGEPELYSSHFKAAAISGDATYNLTVTYTDGSYAGASDLVSVNSNKLSFYSDPFVYVKVQ